MIAEVTPNEIEMSKIISATLTDSQQLAGVHRVVVSGRASRPTFQ
jgi:hypothetical protein